MDILFLVIFGLVVGSFLNVCIYRLPKDESIVTPPSHCMACGTKLKAVDLLPVISYLWLRGRCRYCGAVFSTRYALVEVLTAALFVWCYFAFGWGPAFFKAVLFASFLVVITFIDFDHQLILDKVLLWMAGLGVIVNLLQQYASYWMFYIGWQKIYLISYVHWLDMVIAALVGGGLMLVLALVSRGGMGGGDIKFAAVLGLWLGWKLTLLTLLIAFVVGGLGGVILMLLKIRGRKDYIPFGPFIAIGAFIGLIYGARIILWYMGSLH